VPHRADIESAADFELPRYMREVQRHHQHIGDALVAFTLEMMLGHPERVVAHPVHELGHCLRLVEHGDQVLVWKPAIVHRNPAITDVVHVDMTGKQAVEFGDHGRTSTAMRRKPQALADSGPATLSRSNEPG
jgi:hypothetical protein